ncbi:hypothetical protein DFH09DRAFT_853496, partial [Mycena vulgaris]
TLPPEVICEIFLHCLPDTEYVEPDSSSAPLLMCWICRQWRDIALATPGLWASLYLDLDRFCLKEDPTQGLDDLFCAWLSNARNKPLSVKI